jgi:hypothetical protein
VEPANHSLEDLFEQLGLDHSGGGIDAFVEQHKPLTDDILLQDAPFWTSAQSAFIQQALEQDADWAILVDTLDSMLRN